MVMDEGLPLGLIANTAAILGITLGKTLPEVVGAAVEDASGQSHLGIIEFPVPQKHLGGHQSAARTAVSAGISGTDSCGFLRFSAKLQDLHRICGTDDTSSRK